MTQLVHPFSGDNNLAPFHLWGREIVLENKKVFFFFFFFFEVSALLDVRHCPNLQSCAISRKTSDTTLRKWQKS